MNNHSIEVKVTFRAGHRLMAPYKGKCNNPHGEGYTAIFLFSSPCLNDCDMVADFGEIKKQIKEWIDNNLDHSYMYKQGDEVGEFLKAKGYKVYKMLDNPTAEKIAKLLYCMMKNKLPKLQKVGVIESFDDSIAWFEERKEAL